MFKIVPILFAFIACSAASGYGRGGGGGGYGGSSGGGGYGSVSLAIQSKRSRQVIPSYSSGDKADITEVDVDGPVSPVKLNFNSESSPLIVTSNHRGSGGSYKSSQSEDEPHVRVHKVTRPVIHELEEVIQPYRRVKQIINPVQEEIQRIIHGKGGNGGGGGYGGGNGGGYGGGNDGYGKGGY